MAVRRIFIWTCLTCNLETATAKYGGAPGYVWFYFDGEIEHWCPECAKIALDEGRAKVDPKDEKHLILLVKS